MGLFDDIRKLTQPYEEDGEEFFEDTDTEEEAPVFRRTERASRMDERRGSTQNGSLRGGYSAAEDDNRERVYRPSNADSRPPFRDTNEYAREEDGRTDFGASAKNRTLNIPAQVSIPVALIQPERFEQAAEIADHLRDRCAVVMNLERASRDVARRLVDFLSGVAYANDGKIQKVAVNTYILLPFRWNLAGNIMDELENSGAGFF